MSSISDFKVLERIGSGTFGICCKVCLRSDNSKVLAWKEIDYRQFSESELRMLCQEVNLLRALRHPNIVAFQGRLLDTPTSRVFVVMEYCQNGDLRQLVSSLAGVNRLLPHRHAPEAFVRRVCAQLLDALHYCHTGSAGAAATAGAQGPVIHRDLKPANVLLDAGWNAKLADFGLSRVLSSAQSLATTFVGSLMYMSPELLGDDGFTTPKSDIWALGCVLHELMALKAPFTARTETLLRLQIRNGSYSQLPISFSPALRRLTLEMLNLDVTHRPGAGDLLARPEVRQWAAAAARPWSEQASRDDDCSGDDNAGSGARTRLARQSERREVLLLQARLANAEARLLSVEADLQDREGRIEQAEADLKERDARLAGLDAKLRLLSKALNKKQRLLALAETETKAVKTSDSTAQPRTSRPAPHQRTLTLGACPNLSPILASKGTPQLSPGRTPRQLDGKYSPLTVHPSAQPPPSLPGQYRPTALSPGGAAALECQRQLRPRKLGNK